MWVLLKNAPLSVLLKRAPWVLAMYCAIPVLHVRQGRWRTVWRLYRDAILGAGVMLRSRWREVEHTIGYVPLIEARIDPRFYEGGRFREALRELIVGTRANAS
jgi:hypothetical protein